MDYSTQYAGAVPLQAVTAPKVAKELLKMVMWVGLPQEILTHQGANFVLHIWGLMWNVGRETLETSVYHPWIDALVK